MKSVGTASVCLAIALLASAAPALAGTADVRIDPAQADQAAENAKLETALSRKISVEFDATPLSEALVFIRTVGRVGVVVDAKAGDAGKQAVTLTLKETPLRDVLDQVLASAGLKWRVSQGAVLVSPAAAPKPAAGAREGGEGAGTKSVEFVQTPANEVIGFVSERTGVNIVIDPKVREKLKAPITFKTTGMTYRQVLDWTVKLSGTAWTLTDGVLYVTSRENVPKVDVNEVVRKFLAENPKFFEKPAEFEPPPKLDFPKMK